MSGTPEPRRLALGRLALAKFAWLFAVLLLLGCAPEPSGPLWADPGIVRLSPDHTRTVIEIHNHSGTPRPISNIALRGPNWDSLRFVDETHPRTVPADGSVQIELEVSAASFQTASGQYGSGSATLEFSSNKHESVVPIQFIGAAPEPTLGSRLAWLALLAGFAALLSWSPLRTGQSSWTSPERALAAATLAALVLAASAIPLGVGVCPGRLRELVGPRELGECRELFEVSVAPAIWWWIASLTFAAVTLALLRARTRNSWSSAGPEVALAGLRALGMTLILASLVLGLAPADDSASALVLAQARTIELAGLDVPRWGLVAQPLAAALAFALVATARPLGSSSDSSVALLERLESLMWIAVLAVAFLGGPAIPWASHRAIPILTHGATLTLELAMLLLELSLLAVAAMRIRQHLGQLSPARLVAIHSRITIPLALLHVVLVLIWRAA